MGRLSFWSLMDTSHKLSKYFLCIADKLFWLFYPITLSCGHIAQRSTGFIVEYDSRIISANIFVLGKGIFR